MSRVPIETARQQTPDRRRGIGRQHPPVGVARQDAGEDLRHRFGVSGLYALTHIPSMMTSSLFEVACRMVFAAAYSGDSHHFRA